MAQADKLAALGRGMKDPLNQHSSLNNKTRIIPPS